MQKGGLVTARHKELRDGLADLAGKAFNPLPRARRPPHLLMKRREGEKTEG